MRKLCRGSAGGWTTATPVEGGTYTVDGNNYAETIEYANKNTADLIKKTMKFKIKVEGDTYTQIGVGNPYSEVWKRTK